MTFDEDSAYNKSRKRPAEDPKESEVPIIHDTTIKEAIPEEDREVEEPQEPILTRGNLLGYEKLSKVQKDTGLQKRITEKGRGPGPAPGK